MTTLTVVQHRFPTHSTVVATLSKTLNEQGTQQLSEPGSGAITLPRDTLVRVVTDGVRTNADATITSATALFSSHDVGLPVTGTGIPAGTTIASINSATSAEMSANATSTASGATFNIGFDLRVNDLLRYKIDGTVQHASIIERFDDHTLDEEGGSQQFTTGSGRDVKMLPEWGRIGPANGFGASPIETDRLFAWMSPEYDDSGWDAAELTGLARVPAEFPAASGGPYIGGPTPDLAGVTYLRDTFTLADDVEATAFLSADNWGRLYIDGQDILVAGGQSQGNSYLRTFTETVVLTAGTHTVAVRLFNKGPTHAGIRYLLATTDADGGVDDVLHQSDTSWNVLQDPASVPGMTPGQAVLIALGEIQARGGLTWLGTDFDEDVDTDATAWPIVADISTRTGNDLLTFLMELSATYIDWTIDPTTLTLSMWVKDDQGTASGVTLEPAAVSDPTTGNLVELDRVRT